MTRKTKSIRLVKVEQLTENVKHFYFEQDEKMDFIPGQFISLQLPHDEKPLLRSYSLAQLPNSSYLEFAASYVSGGFASEILFNLEIGAELEMMGPFGRLILKDEEPKRLFLIATGTGITPYRTMIDELKQRLSKTNMEIYVLFGIQRKSDILYLDDWLSLCETYPNFHFTACCSKESPEENYCVSGYVQKQLKTLSPQAGKDIIYLCGNPNMIDDTFKDLIDSGFESKDIRREKYISP